MCVVNSLMGNAGGWRLENSSKGHQAKFSEPVEGSMKAMGSVSFIHLLLNSFETQQGSIILLLVRMLLFYQCISIPMMSFQVM